MRVRLMLTTMALVVAAVVIVACGRDGRVALPVATATPGPSPTAVVTPTPRTPTSQPAPTPVPLEALFEQAKASVQERGYDLTDYTFTVDQQGRRVLALSSRCHFPPGLDISMLANPGFPCSTTHFFLEDQYLGTDTFYTYLGTGSLMPSDPGQFRIGYTTYAPGDPRCCPSVWDEVVYTWDGQKLNASGEPPSPFGKPFSETGTPAYLEGWRGWAKANGWNVQQPAPPPAEEPPPPTLEAILPVQLPQSTYADDCQAWLDAGAPAEDSEGMAACTLLASEVCTAWLSDPSVPGGSDACALLETLTAYSQPSYPPSTTLNCRYLEGTIIVGQDGQYLGVITCSKYDVDGIFNKYGTYGSKYSSKSIWNKYGSYGGKYSRYSPFNKYSSSPPQIMGASGFVAYLSVNSYVGGTVVDPLDLVLCCFGDRQSDLEYWLELIP